VNNPNQIRPLALFIFGERTMGLHSGLTFLQPLPLSATTSATITTSLKITLGKRKVSKSVWENHG
jgi:hypothetical protein